MEDAAQREQELHRGIADNLNQLGHSETPQTVNPEDHSALRKIKQSIMDTSGEIAHIVGAPLDEIARGQASHIGLKESKSWRQRLMERVKRK